MAERGSINSLPPSLSKVPTELLQKIFREYHKAVFVPLAFRAGNDHPFADRFPAILLGSICSAWRDVAISTPDIWNKIPISVSTKMLPSYTGAQDAQLALVTLCLQRTLGYPALHIHLTGMYSRADETDTRALSAAMEHAHRWASLHIDVAEHVLSFLDGLRGRLSSLVSLTLEKSLKPAGASQIFVQAQALRAFAFDHRAPRFFLPYAQLSVLTANTVYLLDLPSVLTQCHSLRTLNIIGNIEGPFPYRGNPKESSDVRLPSLERLVVNIQGKRTDVYLLARLFAMLTLPALRDVQLMQDETSAKGTWAACGEFLKMMQRSGKEDADEKVPLQQLALLNVSIPASELVSCLRETPRLRDLWVDVRTNGTLTDDLLENLRLDERPAADTEVADDSSGPPSDSAEPIEERRERLLPELERLHISCPASFSAETLMNMVRSRTAPQRTTPPTYEDAARAADDNGETAASKASEPASPLRYINIHCTDPALRVEPQIVARLRIMAAAGIKLFFRIGDRDVVHDDR